MLGRGVLMPERARIAFRASSSGNTGTVTKPTGVAVGDLVLVVWSDGAGSPGTLSTTLGDAWTVNQITWGGAHVNFTSTVGWKFLTATDVANAWTFGAVNNEYVCAAYEARGATALTVKTAQNDEAGAGTTLAITGFTANYASRGTITAASDDDQASALTAPTGFTRRQTNTGAVFSQALADNVDYASGTMTWGVNAGTGQVGWALEAT